MSHVLILGDSPAGRASAVQSHLPSGRSPLVLDTATLAFMRSEYVALPPSPRAVVLPDIDRAFPDAQAGGTRLVLTQSTYLLQKWIDRLDEGDVIVASADRAALERCAPEAFQSRGPWARFEIIDTKDTKDLKDTKQAEDAEDTRQPTLETTQTVASSVAIGLSNAYATRDQSERVRLCRDAAASDPSCEVACLALASALRETRDGAGARDALERAAVLAPDWEAIAYESGKLWLVYDDLIQARDAFQRAADLMPTFSAAFSNLGATLGELDQPAAALAAFRQALAHDTRSYTILNNIGVVCRELQRFDESEAALLRVNALNPGFVFGYYNLGHTRFLAGNYREALTAYQEGRRRDPQHNPRQGCRLAVVRLATGDAAGAERDLWQVVNAAPAGQREDLLLEAYEVAHALLIQHPALEAHRPLLERIGAEIVKSE